MFGIMPDMRNVQHRAINVTTGDIIAARVIIAEDFRSRSVGLLNRTSIEEDEGLLIKPCNSIHTFFMKFPIDVVFLDRKCVVVRIIKDLMPWRLAWSIVRGYMVLEIKQGILNKMHVKVNDLLRIE